MESQELRAMLASDERHWWYRGRRRVICAELGRLPLPRGARMLDVGCGSGRTLQTLAAFGRVEGLDASAEAVAAARERGVGPVAQGRIEALPFEDATFDLVTCLDVIEHTPDDRASLAEIARVTRAGGWAILTVPAHPVLWSHHDEVNQHYRRYRRSELAAAAEASGFVVDHDSYFNLAALAPAALVRLAQRARPAWQRGSDLALSPAWADRVLELPLAAEARLLARGFRVPAGLSLIAVLHRPPAALVARPARRVPSRVPELSPA